MEQLETSNTAGDTRLGARHVVDRVYIEHGLDGVPERCRLCGHLDRGPPVRSGQPVPNAVSGVPEWSAP
jgi:hypothetical protein